MANGKPSDDSEEFVLRSGPRSGLKREFAFALKVHSEVSGSLGRTRSRKLPSSPPPSRNGVSSGASNKKIKIPGAEDDVAEESKRIEISGVDVATPVEESNKNGKIQSPSSCNGVSVDLSDNRIKTSEISSDGDAMVVEEESKRESDAGEILIEKEDSGTQTETCIEVEDKKSDLEEIPIEKEGSGAEIGIEVENKKMEVDEIRFMNENSGTETPMVVDNGNAEKMAGGDAEKMECDAEKVVDQGVLMDQGVLKAPPLITFSRTAKIVESDAKKAVTGDVLKTSTLITFSRVEKMEGDAKKLVDGDVLKTPPPPITFSRRFTRSVADKIVDGNEGKIVDGDLSKTLLASPPSGRITRLDTERMADGDAEKMAGIEVEKIVDDNAEKMVDGSVEKIVNRNVDMVVDGDTKKGVDGNALETPLPLTPARRFTRSIAEKTVVGHTEKMLEMDGDKMVDDNAEKTVDGNVLNTLHLTYPPPARRVTRSILKGNPDPSISAASEMDGGSAVSESDIKPCKNEAVVEIDAKTTDEVTPLSGSSKKLELKMSKKIALKKMPSNMRDLLATGLLEGFPIKYIFRSNKAVLKGTIKGDGILCYCSSCNGSKVVLPFEFEKHAGSLNKHPSQYIHFENGKTFREVLNECKRAPLDMLESTLHSALSLPSVKEDATSLSKKKEVGTSQNCKESIRSRVEESKLVSNKYPVSDRSQESPVSGTDDSPASSAVSARLPKACLKTKSSDSDLKQLSSEKKKPIGRLTKKDLRLHKLVFMDDVLPDGTEVAYYARGQRLLEGYITGGMIFCGCCNSEVSPSQFEAHAGWASRRKPYLHIYTSNGVSLHELSVSLSKDRKFSANDNDDLCTICADGGDLLCCDTCPRAFHKDCVGLSSVPRGDWYCQYCQTLFEKDKSVAYNDNAKAAGRVPGVDPIEQITKRCIRIVKTLEADLTVCVLCRSHDFNKAGFGPRTVLLCDQCEKEYHVGCLKDHKMGDLKKLPEGKWFCCSDCHKIHTALEKLVVRGSEALPNSLSNVIRQKHSEKSSSNCADLDVRWRLLSGRITSSDSRLLLSKAVAIFHDCFDPINDSATSKDLIPSIVYGRNIRDQEFGGMYCAVLTVNSSVVSAGILRIFGQEIAELPLVATSSGNQGKGYFQALFSCIERLLGFLNVKNLLLPAADEAESIWTKKFGFKKINEDELAKLTKDSRVMTFQGTSMLHKLVPKCRIIGRPAKAS